MNTGEKIKVAVIGASGYTGAELVRLLASHPHVQIKYLAAESNAGKSLSSLYPHFAGLTLPKLVSLNDVGWLDIDVAFFCLPHGSSQDIINALPRTLRIIDLSADFRLFSPEVYKQWYGKDHVAAELQKEAVYGLTEFFREPVKHAQLVACPGCYPTSILLPLIPLFNIDAISPDGIIVDSKSGVTGAGRSAKVANLFPEVNEGVKPYGIGGHRHVAEVEQLLAASAGKKELRLTFVPQIVPMSRGILSTIYVKLMPESRVEDVKQHLLDRFEHEHFVTVFEDDTMPITRAVKGTNHCFINVFRERVESRVVIVSAIDNLLKGASGQAVQNFNVMHNLPETTGLTHTALFP